VRNAWLIFRHELAGAIRRTGFIIMTLIVPVLALLAIGIAKLALASGAPRTETTEVVGFVDESGAFGQFTNQGSITLRRFGSVDEATRAMVDGAIQEYVVIPVDVVATSSLARFTVRKELAPSDATTAAIQTFLASNLLADRVPAATMRFVEAPVSFVTTRLDARGAVAADQGGVGTALIPLGFGLLLVLSLIFSSSYLVQGLADEKENRLMEVLISRVSPGELLIGKVLGLGAAGLVQVAIWLVSMPLLLLLASSLLGGPVASLHVPPLFYPLAIVYFVLGFLLFATLCAGVGAISTSVREAGQLSALFTFFPVVPLWLMSLFIAFPQSPFWIVLSIFPLTAPTMVIERLGVSDIPAWQIVASVGLLAASVVGGLFFAGRLFRTYLLRFGQRPRLGEIVRSFRGRKGSS
jgi:ABC-2 type transport system permease protein